MRGTPKKDVDEFVFRQAVRQHGAITGPKAGAQRGGGSKLLDQAGFEA